MKQEIRLFLVETNEQVDELERSLLIAEETKRNTLEAITAAFSAIESMQSSSEFLDFHLFGECCRQAKQFLSRHNRTLRVPGKEEMKILYHFVDAARSYLTELEEGIETVSSETSLKRWLQSNDDASSLPEAA
jgi:chemotaxis protein histidine kinase CheA